MPDLRIEVKPGTHDGQPCWWVITNGHRAAAAADKDTAYGIALNFADGDERQITVSDDTDAGRRALEGE